MSELLQFRFNKTTSRDVTIYIGHGMTEALCDAIDRCNPDRVFIVYDEAIPGHYSTSLTHSIRSRGYKAHTISIEAGETAKNLQSVVDISNAFFDSRGTENSLIIPLGGGVVGNIAGLFASIVYRGVGLIHVPTTLLSQLDSAADVKQSVNSNRVKNAIGAIRAPDSVIVDTAYLGSLSDRELRSGIGEAVKHGLAQDTAFVDFLVDANIKDENTLQNIISTTLHLKINHWKSDPSLWDDNNMRTKRLTHLGHTTGKILEMLDLDHLTHGEAIAHGMSIEAYLAYLLGYLDLKSANWVHSVLAALELFYPLSKKQSTENTVDALYTHGKNPVFALLKALGTSQTVSTTAPRKLVRKAVAWHHTQLQHERT